MARLRDGVALEKTREKRHMEALARQASAVRRRQLADRLYGALVSTTFQVVAVTSIFWAAYHNFLVPILLTLGIQPYPSWMCSLSLLVSERGIC